MHRPASAAIYARISSDHDGLALGVRRQLQDCRRLATQCGWEVADEYVDNDVSAASGRRRPEYARMLEDLKEGRRDAVVAYHLDRLTRRPIELEQFVQVAEAAGVREVRFVAGNALDIANGDSVLVLRMLAAVAANESAGKSRRVKRKLDEVAAAGRPHGGSNRPFGYAEDKITVRPDEAEILRALAERYVSGESLRSLASWLDEHEVRTAAGGEWRSNTVRTALTSARIAGLRVHRGEVIGEAVWDPIITLEMRERILARAEQQRVEGRRTPRRYLLSGLLRCGRCGGKLFSSPRVHTRRYVCLSGPDHGGGCGRLTITAAPVEELITEAVLHRLDTPELAKALTGNAGRDEQLAAVSEALAQDMTKLDELAELFAADSITTREWMAARSPIEARIADTKRRLARLTDTDALGGYVGNADQLRAQWTNLNLTRQNAIVRAVLDHAVVSPATSSAFDPDRVEPIWRL